MKPLSDFYKHAAMADGHLNKCKPCVKSRVSGHREENLDRIQAYDRERGRTEPRRELNRKYASTPRGHEIASKAKSDWRSRNPEKQKAHGAVARAVRTGRLTRMPCEICGSVERIEAHHDDYTKPLEVRWLCDPHHKARHVELRWSDEPAEQELSQ